MLLMLLHTVFLAPARSTGDLNVKSALAQQIIDPQLPLTEVQAYTESRILPMPETTTVAE